MKKLILAAVILIPSTIVGMKEDLSAAKLATLIKNGANTFEVKSFLDKPGVKFEIICGNDSASVANLSQALKDHYFEERDPELYGRFKELFTNRYYYEPLE